MKFAPKGPPLIAIGKPLFEVRTRPLRIEIRLKRVDVIRAPFSANSYANAPTFLTDAGNDRPMDGPTPFVPVYDDIADAWFAPNGFELIPQNLPYLVARGILSFLLLIGLDPNFAVGEHITEAVGSKPLLATLIAPRNNF